jgi:hypothetical protein
MVFARIILMSYSTTAALVSEVILERGEAGRARRIQSQKTGAHKVYRLYERLRSEVLQPILNTPPEEVEGYLEGKYKGIEGLVADYLEESLDYSVSGEVDVLKALGDFRSDLVSGRLGGAYERKVIERIVEVLGLIEANQKLFARLMRTPEKLVRFLELVPIRLKEAGIGFDEFIELSLKMTVVNLCVVEGVFLNQKRLEPVMEKLTELALKYGEEYDDAMTMLEIFSKWESGRGLEEAYKEALDVIGRRN